MDRFTILSWVLTGIVVVGLLGSTLLYKSSLPTTYVPAAQPTSAPGADQPQVGVPIAGVEGSGISSILRDLQLKTNIPERPRYQSILYRVSRGDAMLKIAGEFKIKYESILYVNKQMDDNPHSLKPGMELIIPPVDGLYYEWKDGDTFETVAEKFSYVSQANAEDIITFPGNKVDLTDPKIEPGTLVMIPGGSRELRNWAADLQTVGRNPAGGTGTSEIGGNACGGGPVAAGFGWPADAYSLSGNGYGPGHLGIDITAPEGSNVYAAGSGIVTQAQVGYNYGYGNVVQIDHGSGYVTVYAHLSQINVGVCQPVGQGTVIGYSGNTGNSFGAHLHFEIRIGGTNINPYDIVQ
ncbi:MAG: LysM peptidoglycan-binding domain-containing M23 family metallopeptidase [Anaerolineales bacterium]|nr:LysM peptidoglycan-binding domain-containing M23 family metallopeptidase [Anaerolineales bacterium]